MACPRSPNIKDSNPALPTLALDLTTEDRTRSPARNVGSEPLAAVENNQSLSHRPGATAQSQQGASHPGCPVAWAPLSSSEPRSALPLSGPAPAPAPVSLSWCLPPSQQPRPGHPCKRKGWAGGCVWENVSGSWGAPHPTTALAVSQTQSCHSPAVRPLAILFSLRAQFPALQNGHLSLPLGALDRQGERKRCWPAGLHIPFCPCGLCSQRLLLGQVLTPLPTPGVRVLR